MKLVHALYKEDITQCEDRVYPAGMKDNFFDAPATNDIIQDDEIKNDGEQGVKIVDQMAAATLYQYAVRNKIDDDSEQKKWREQL